MTSLVTRSIPAALTGRRLAVVGVEGNGGRPPQIVEIAVLTLDEPVHRGDVATWLVGPLAPITPLATRTAHGISNADVADCPRWNRVTDEVADLLTAWTLVAHNASVEHEVLGTYLPAWRPLMVLDTLPLAKHVWPGLLGGYGLDWLIIHADLNVDNEAGDITNRRHRSGYYTWMTTGLLFALVEHSGLDWPGLLRAAAPPGFNQPHAPDQRERGLW